ncbi:adenosylcobinamide-phosphate guanylyltransferase [Corynebacterium kutscheri]|uniref:Adenosylcobinamide kinase n=1 Tax=Corynebacterium kutscheri TaxID=35755 RepID=A0A0F6TE77_9CORY|nr:bifunctional adenosylcobinamide kinase/adenosylcobinamide-phosphate guanylyltransferase [Corynebacterium kutscheri]AKE41599.1 adenosylcobinamide-phosphate guanylyltransferase [Corynebacterium kutscheri]VEH09925.1 putative cobinamide kinase/cobinamide phosphate guanylyltransferase [Corynebacterium kutscheri]
MRSLILGGARSGKSAFAESLIRSQPCLYVATARKFSGDTDFERRISLHRQRRPDHWLLDESHELVDILNDNSLPEYVLVDDLGTWLTHIIDRRNGWDSSHSVVKDDIAALCEAITHFPHDKNLIVVTPEVGMGIIPEHRSGRRFRDEIGRLNEQIADICDSVFFVVAGQALQLKGS